MKSQIGQIVVDKSYIQGQTANQLLALRSKYQFLMPTAFFMELLTASDPKQLSRIASKFPANENPAGQVHLAKLLTFEIENDTPAWPDEQFVKRDFIFNPDLAKPDFPFLPEDAQRLKDWETQTSEMLQHSKIMWASVVHWFPELRELKGNTLRDAAHGKMTEIGSNDELVREIYRQFRTERHPAADSIDGRWTIFRQTQVNLLSALNYVGKYGANPSVAAQDLHNDILDIEYVILASLVEALASCDKTVRKYFALMCPEGVLIPGEMPG